MNNLFHDITSDMNDAQRTVVQNLPGPLFVSAGAGSGKTKTLTSGIGASFVGNSKGFKLESINQLLAITFTEKAAAELLSRVKAKIVELKPFLINANISESDLNVDTSWITTIHGFCSRFLRENSLEIGLDPEFDLLDELQQKDLEFTAKENVLKQISSGEIYLEGLDNQWNLTGFGSLLDCAQYFCNKVLSMPNKFDDIATFNIPPISKSLSSIYRSAITTREIIESWSTKNTTDEKILEDLNSAITFYENSNLDSVSFSDILTPQELSSIADLVTLFPKLPRTLGKAKAKGGTEQFDDIYRVPWANAQLLVYGLQCFSRTEVLKKVAIRYLEEYESLKHEMGLLDQNDLLVYTLDALKSHPNLAKKCQEAYKLIMVDEFQDTDKVQVSILKLISASNFANVCVVGDAQQSIYGFRGADVNTFFDYRESLINTYSNSIECSQLTPQLEINYRSHKDILDFVECIFSDNGKFLGSNVNFLKLEAGGYINFQEDVPLADTQRISIDVTHFEGAKQSECGVQAQIDSARRIALHFRQIKDSYKQISSKESYPRQTFALLLGKTTNAQIYIDEFQKVGLDSILTAGSLLYKSKEARIVLDLIKIAVNKYDEVPLFELLTSELFSISDDILLSLAYKASDSGVMQRSNCFQFWDIEDIDNRGLTEKEIEGYLVAKSLLNTFIDNANIHGLKDSIRLLLLNSGFLDRVKTYGVSGLAIIGNYNKILDIVAEIEQKCCGISEVCESYIAKLDRAKDTPGVLSTEDSDYIQILTIHGSKGLEFDHVAVSDVSVTPYNPGGVYVISSGNKLFALSDKGLKLDPSIDELLGDPLPLTSFNTQDSIDVTDAVRSIVHTYKTESDSELRRLLYVAFTRPVKTLYFAYLPSANLFNDDKINADETMYARSQYDGIFHEIYDAIKWPLVSETNPDVVEEYEKIATFSTNLSKPLKVQFNHVTTASLEKISTESDTKDNSFISSFRVPVRDIPTLPELEHSLGERLNVRSYSSLSQDDKDDDNFPDMQSHHEMLTDNDRTYEIGDAVNLGLAFHKLAQRSIVLQQRTENKIVVVKPNDNAIDAVCRQFHLTPSQISRLRLTLDKWYQSDVFNSLCSHDTLSSEVPFFVDLTDEDNNHYFLEGEIDALATDDTNAYIVDYKTGGNLCETIESAHFLQACCYAYALISSGYTSVQATFVRVEHLKSDLPDKSVIHTFIFNASDQNSLKKIILDKWN